MSDVTSCAYLGGDCKAYYNSATYATPIWVEIDEAIDVNISDFTDTMAEVATRSGSFAYNKPAKTRVAVEMSYLYRANDTVWQFLKGKKLAKDEIDALFIDDDASTDGAEGLRMICYMEAFPINQALEEMVVHDTWRFVPAYACDAGGAKIDPEWVVMSGGQPTVAAMAMAPPPMSKQDPKLLAKLIKMGRLRQMRTPIRTTIEQVIAHLGSPSDPNLVAVLEAIDHLPKTLKVIAHPSLAPPTPPEPE